MITAETEEVTTSIYETLPVPENGFGGDAFTILCRTTDLDEMYSETETGDVVDDAVFQRQSVLEESLNIKLKVIDVTGDWSNPYITLKPEFEAEQIKVFGEMALKGYIYKGLKPVYWCADCETALAEAEVEYQDHTSTSIYVKFEFESQDRQKALDIAKISTDKKLYAVIWTTTPWTIPSNMAISMHPKFEYTFFEYKNDVYVVAQGLLGNFLADVQWEESDINVIGSCIGQDLELLTTKHPLIDF